jgi:lipopolysaccharide biosynthesis glycosyltransferase
VRRILYLDSDTLVLKDVAELWETPLDGNVVGAVRDFTTNRSGQPDGLGYCIEEAGLDPAKPLFNAGVLVIDMDAYRTLQIEDQCVAFLRRWRDHIYSADQDALNGVLHRRWKGLHFRWNVQTGLAVFRTINELSAEEREMLRNLDPAILHFSGSSKPWNSGLRSAQCRQYVRCVQATGWHGRAGFRLWQAKRVAACVRSAMMNRLAPAQLGAAANA